MESTMLRPRRAILDGIHARARSRYVKRLGIATVPAIPAAEQLADCACGSIDCPECREPRPGQMICGDCGEPCRLRLSHSGHPVSRCCAGLVYHDRARLIPYDDMDALHELDQQGDEALAAWERDLAEAGRQRS